MIAASGILVVVAFVTLIVGVFRTGLELIWTSIAASVLAAIFLALGVVQGNKRRVATAGPSSERMPAWSDQPATTAVLERERVPAVEEAEPEEEEEAPILAAVPEPEPEPEAVVTAFEPPKPAAKPAAAKRAPAKRAPAKKAAEPAASSVVVIPDRDKFHRDSCRYANNPAAMTMTKAAARRQGYKACGVCKP